jgi:dihydroneopterin aldolase/2-amino-4-hydroxy-6-hydroxymethyldihydropteridine diphosphokinase
MNKIQISKLTVLAKHGVLPQEKITPQPFVFDVTMYADLFDAGISDDLNLTVNYAEACKIIEDTCLHSSYNLIEKLAYECAFALMQNFGILKKVDVTVNKPQAPIEADFSSVSVSTSIERNIVLLSLGSSIGDKKASLDFAVESLNNLRGVKVLKTSKYYQTEPYGGVAKNTFLNAAVMIECLLPPKKLLFEINKIESNGGRVRDVHWDDRTLDIDIIFFGNKIIAEDGLIVPHPDYFNRQFVLTPLKDIAPDFICPVIKKAIKDIKC